MRAPPAPGLDAPAPPTFLTWQEDGALIDVAVVPNARRTGLAGLHDQALRLRLSAPPVDGAANETLQRWLAEEVGVARSQVQLLRGASSRRKRLRVAAPRSQLEAWLQRVRDALATPSAAARA